MIISFNDSRGERDWKMRRGDDERLVESTFGRPMMISIGDLRPDGTWDEHRSATCAQLQDNSTHRAQALSSALQFEIMAGDVKELLGTYGNKLASLDETARDFIEKTWGELHIAVAFLQLVLERMALQGCIDTGEFAKVEAKFIDAVEVFCKKAHDTFGAMSLYTDLNPDLNQKWPEVGVKLEVIGRLIEELNHAECKVRDAPEKRLDILEVAEGEVRQMGADLEVAEEEVRQMEEKLNLPPNFPDLPEYTARWFAKRHTPMTQHNVRDRMRTLQPSWGSLAIKNEGGRWRIEDRKTAWRFDENLKTNRKKRR